MVVRRLVPAGVAAQPAAHAQPVEGVAAAGEDLVDVRLVPGVEHDRVVRRVEDPVQRDRQLDDAEVRAEVAARRAHLLDEEVADLAGQPRQQLGRKGAQVVGGVDT
ncbi:hypothetical protein GCM10020001_041830 [Nonomuraea salmonea]